MQAKLKVNLKGLDTRMDLALQVVEDKVKDDIERIIEPVLVATPVDTGALITSWSIRQTSGAGRRRTSRNKPRFQPKEQKQAEARAQLYSDLDVLDLRASPNVYITNRAPHATAETIKGKMLGIFSWIRANF